MTINTTSSSDFDAASRLFDRKSLALRTFMPAIVDSKPRKNGHVWCVDVIPAIRQIITIDDVQTNKEMPKIPNVPIMQASSETLGLSVTVPIKKGDKCWILVCDRSIDNWQLDGGIQNQVSETVARHHDLTDAVCLPFGLNISGPPSYNNDAIYIGGNTTNVTIDDSAIKMTDGTGSVELSGGVLKINANVDITGDTTQEGNTTQTGNVTLTGNLIVNGNITATGGISGSTVNASTSLIVAGKEQSGHKHSPGTYEISPTEPVTGTSGEPV